MWKRPPTGFRSGVLVLMQHEQRSRISAPPERSGKCLSPRRPGLKVMLLRIAAPTKRTVLQVHASPSILRSVLTR